MKPLVRIIPAGLVIFVIYFFRGKNKVDLMRGKDYLCYLTRMDQQGNNEFVCETYEPKEDKQK